MSATAVTAPPELVTVRQVAVMLGCSPRTVYRLADAGRMPPAVHLGVLIRWRRAALEDWLSAGCPSVRRIRGGDTR